MSAKKSFRKTTMCMAVVAALPLTNAAVAENRFAIEEVIVTAQKRSETAQDVPIAISAFSGDSIKDQGIQDVRSLITQAPGLSGGSPDSFLNGVSVRGISTNDFGLGGDLSLGVFRNGIHGGRNGEVVSSFFDLERVEVLKGPQGLLFGRAASSGAVHVITKKPTLDDDISGSVSLGGGERGQKRGEVVLNVPLSDNFAVRFAAVNSEEDGYVDNALGGDDLGGHDTKAFRASALYSTDKMAVNLVIEQEHAESNTAIYTQLDPATNYNKPVTGNHRSVASHIGDDAVHEADILNVSLQIDYETDLGTFTSITGARKHQFDLREDTDGIALDFSDFVQDQDGEYFSQEFRLVSPDEGDLSWFVGVSAFKDRLEADYVLNLAPLGAADEGRMDGSTKGAAVYGDLTYHITDKARISVGGRYGYDKREHSTLATNASGLLLTYFTTPDFVNFVPVETEESWNSFTPRVLVEYDLGEDTMLYASATKGFKPGGFDTYGITNKQFVDPTPAPFDEFFLSTAASEPVSFDQEEIISYEIGAKGSLFDDRGTYSISAYYYEYSDLQLQVVDPETLFSFIVTNVGEAEGMGLEAEVLLNLTDNLQLIANASWSDTEIKDMSDAACGGLASLCKGNPLPLSSKLTASANLLGTFSIAGMDAFASAEVVYNDGYSTDQFDLSETTVDDWTEVNLRMGAYLNDSWRVSMFLENATDEEHFAGYSDFRELSDFGLGLNGVGPSSPRTYGFDVTYSF